MDSKERDLFAAWNRLAPKGIDVLSPDERAFLAIWELEAEVKSGGFAQWMFDTAGDRALLAVAGLRRIGATAAADICERFFALLPGGAPAADQAARQEQLDAAEAARGDDAFAHACFQLEEELQAVEDDLRDRLWTLVADR